VPFRESRRTQVQVVFFWLCLCVHYKLSPGTKKILTLSVFAFFPLAHTLFALVHMQY